MRQVQCLSASVVRLSVHPRLVVAPWAVLDPPLGLQQQHRSRSKSHSACRTHAGASRLQPFFQPVAAKLALGDARIESLPLETRNVVWASDRAVATANAFLRRP